ncbi:MAG: DNA-directed RNA polymerase [Candidatus Aenigmarchaeota archaeon]
MYKIMTVEDKIRVPPAKFRLDLENAIKASLEDRWEGIVDKELGVILSVVSIGEVGEGKILPGDGSIHYPVDFELLVYQPTVHEAVKGYVIDVTEFGVFIRIGPVDGMIHVSQIMDDFVTYDGKNASFIGRETKRSLKDKDIVTTRIISVSMEKQYKIGLTTRQVGLGGEDWADKIKKAQAAKGRKSAAKGPAKAPKKGGKKEKKLQ